MCDWRTASSANLLVGDRLGLNVPRFYDFRCQLDRCDRFIGEVVSSDRLVLNVAALDRVVRDVMCLNSFFGQLFTGDGMVASGQSRQNRVRFWKT